MSGSRCVSHATIAATMVCESLRQGPHWNVRHQAFRGLAGIAVLAWYALLPRRDDNAPKPLGDRNAFVVSNPVAHGAKLANAVAGLIPPPCVLVADSRMSALGLDHDDFPSVAIRSVGRCVSLPDLIAAIRLRWHWHNPERSWTRRVFTEYLFLAQSVRFRLARRFLRGVGHARILVADFDRDSYAAPLMLTARDYGITTVSLIHGTPNAANYLPFFADHALVWGQVQADWVSRTDPATKVHVVGRPEFSDVPIDVSGPARMLIVHSCEDLTSAESATLRGAIADASIQRLGVELRLHPSDPHMRRGVGWQEIREAVLGAGGRWLVGLNPTELAASDLVVVVSSSAAVDALVRGLTPKVCADQGRSLPPDLEVLRSRQTAPETFGADDRSEIVAAVGVTAQSNIRAVLAELACG